MTWKLNSVCGPVIFTCLLLISCNSPVKLIPHEGFVEVQGGKVWYRVTGSGSGTPLLLLHGGPGSASYYLNPLKALGENRPVIFIDQLGSGRSGRITDTALMTIENYVNQVEAVRKELELKDFYLYGHSWGTMLGIEYYLKYPGAVKAIIFSSPLFSTEMWIKDADTLIATLPDSVQEIIRRNEKAKTYDGAEYKSATDIYYQHFLHRVVQQSADLDSGRLGFSDSIYRYMWGPSEFRSTGTLKHFDRLKELQTIRVPTLFLCGEFDEARPNTVNYYHQQVKGSVFAVIPNAGHLTMSDNPEVTIRVMNDFLANQDNR